MLSTLVSCTSIPSDNIRYAELIDFYHYRIATAYVFVILSDWTCLSLAQAMGRSIGAVVLLLRCEFVYVVIGYSLL